MPRVCLQFVIVIFPDHTHLLFLNPITGIGIVNVEVAHGQLDIVLI